MVTTYKVFIRVIPGPFWEGSASYPWKAVVEEPQFPGGYNTALQEIACGFGATEEDARTALKVALSRRMEAQDTITYRRVESV